MISSGEVRERWQRRQLASDRRAGRWARGQARERQNEYLQRTWPRLLLFGVVALAAAPTLLLVPRGLRGFGLGLLVASTVWVVVVHVIVTTGTASMMSGEFAERLTAAELRRLDRRRWRIVNAVHLRADRGDIDHVAIGAGGIIALETKWIGASCDRRDVLDDRVREAVSQISKSASRLFNMFKNGVPKSAYATVVVLWGPGAEDWGAVTTIEGVTVVHGRDLRCWFRERLTDQLTDAAVDRVWTELIGTLEARDAADLAKGARPKSIAEHAWRFVALAVAIVVGFTAVMSVVGLYPHLSIVLALLVVATTVTVAARRWRPFAPYAIRLGAGAVCAGGLVLVAAFAVR